MNSDVESYIRENCPWGKLPLNVKQILGNSQKTYENCIMQYSIKNQLRYRGNLVRHVKDKEKSYYEELLRYSRDHLMLYPYHLSDSIVTGMRLTPFQYYISVMQDLMDQERSYDSLPNFTAADCLRLLGIGRNQYIELMNRCRSSKKFFGVRKKSVRDLLPTKPVTDVSIDPWWTVRVGYVTEDDIKLVSDSEKNLIDRIIDCGPQKAGELDLQDVRALYLKGLVYLDVPVEDGDYIVVPPLEGFVMNRVLGDYLETLLYKIFVSIDEHTTVAELSSVLQTDLQLVKNAISIYCRLGFARKKGAEEMGRHPSWKTPVRMRSKQVEEFVSLLDTDEEGAILEGCDASADIDGDRRREHDEGDFYVSSPQGKKRIGFLFDSTLTAFLMMGNLSQGLKSHAVTMFEVGKLSDESMDSFLAELGKVVDVGEGEARRYFRHALTLRNTVTFLRNNPDVAGGLGLDLIRCESLLALENDTCNRLLTKNYELLVSMAPLTNEIRPVTGCHPPHLGPALPEVNSVWFKLFLYASTGSGPPTLLLSKGTRLRVLPRVFRVHERLLVTTWGHDPGVVPAMGALPTLNDALCHSAVLVQGQGRGGEVCHVPFPFVATDHAEEEDPIVQELSEHLDLRNSCGYVTLIRTVPNSCPEEEEDFIRVPHHDDWTLLDCNFGIPLFDADLNGAVCRRIAKSGIFSCQQSLSNLTESSQKLSLELLRFIGEKQDGNVTSDGKNALLPALRDCRELAFPRINLIFVDGVLEEWDGT